MALRRSRLSVCPSVDLVTHARAALAGARYHLARIQREISTMRRTPGSHNANVNTLHWHLRAFFWELVATMETTTWVVSPDRRFPTRSPEGSELEQAKESGWWQEVEELRNLAHRAFLFLQAEVHADGRLIHLVLPSLPHSAQHAVPDRLEYYVGKMTNLQRRVLPGSDP